jgi:hypothetical protein
MPTTLSAEKTQLRERKGVLHWIQRAVSDGTGLYSLIALLAGIIILMGAFFIEDPAESTRIVVHHILRELGVVLVSVFGVSLLYEKLSAEEHFNRFSAKLGEFVRRGESNAAACEALGILEIHRSRQSFQMHHSLADESVRLHEGSRLRLTGRSLHRALGDWGQFQSMLIRGARLELCMCDPKHAFEALKYLSRYLPSETQSAIERFRLGLVPWLLQALPKGEVELRLHRFDLLDSLLEIDHDDRHRAALDMNFGQGTEARYVLDLDAHEPLGQSLAVERYELIWQHADVVYRYNHGIVEVDKVTGVSHSEPSHST